MIVEVCLRDLKENRGELIIDAKEIVSTEFSVDSVADVVAEVMLKKLEQDELLMQECLESASSEKGGVDHE